MRRRQVGLDSSESEQQQQQSGSSTPSSRTSSTKKSSDFPLLRFILQFSIAFAIIGALYYSIEVYEGKQEKALYWYFCLLARPAVAS